MLIRRGNVTLWKQEVSNVSEQDSGEYWEQVQDIGQLKLGEATTVKFQRGVTKDGAT